MFCRVCGIEIDNDANVCRNCGAKIYRLSEKSWIVALLLCFFLGFLGVHRLYVGKKFTAGIQFAITLFVTVATFGFSFFIGLVWPLLDFFCILCGKFNDIHDHPLRFKPLKEES